MNGIGKKTVCVIFAIAILLSSVSLVYASGFSIYEQGVRALGRGGAFTATADDPTAIFFNPAGIGQLKGTHFTSGISIISPQVRFFPNNNFPGPTERFFKSTIQTPGNGFDGEISNNFFFPGAFYLTQSVGSRVTLGYGLYFPFSLATDFTNWRNDNSPPVTTVNGQAYSNRYPGRFATSRVLLNTTMHNPTVGIEVNKNVYLGFGFDIAHADVTMERSFLQPDDPGTLALGGLFAAQLFPPLYAANPAAAARTVVGLMPEGRARLSGEAMGYGGNAGVLFKIPQYSTNIAFSYRSPITLHINGTSNFAFAPATSITPYIGGTLVALFPPSVPVNAVLKLPPTYTFGIANQHFKKTELAFDFVMQDYRTVKNFGINFGTHTLALQDQVIPVSNRPSLQYRFGLEHQQTESFAYRLGYYYDVNPLPDKDVGVLQPDSNRNGFTAGLTLPTPELLPFKTTMDLNYMFILFQKRSVATATNVALGLAGEWRGTAHIFGIGFNMSPRVKAPVVVAHPTATCTVESSPIMEGKTTNVTALISDFDLDTVAYGWSTSGGKVTGAGSTVVFDSAGAAPGTYTVTAKINDKKANQATCSASVVVEALPPKPNRNPAVSCSVDRASLMEGESTRVHATASDPEGDPLTYEWTTSAGRLTGTGADVTFNSAGVPAGTTVTVGVMVSDGRGGTANCSSTIQINALPLKPQPQSISCLSAGFPHNLARINNVDKACLDDVSLKMQNDPRSTLTITGYSDASEATAKALAKKRAESAKEYLVKGQKLDPGRISVQSADPLKGNGDDEQKSNRRVEIVFYPEGTQPK
jgi:long-subunit fatty acid transport protein/outer membrane protein OmpA-like peptidoglycan-associated protein